MRLSGESFMYHPLKNSSSAITFFLTNSIKNRKIKHQKKQKKLFLFLMLKFLKLIYICPGAAMLPRRNICMI